MPKLKYYFFFFILSLSLFGGEFIKHEEISLGVENQGIITYTAPIGFVISEDKIYYSLEDDGVLIIDTSQYQIIRKIARDTPLRILGRSKDEVYLLNKRNYSLAKIDFQTGEYLGLGIENIYPEVRTIGITSSPTRLYLPIYQGLPPREEFFLLVFKKSDNTIEGEIRGFDYPPEECLLDEERGRLFIYTAQGPNAAIYLYHLKEKKLELLLLSENWKGPFPMTRMILVGEILFIPTSQSIIPINLEDKEDCPQKRLPFYVKKVVFNQSEGKLYILGFRWEKKKLKFYYTTLLPSLTSLPEVEKPLEGSISDMAVLGDRVYFSCLLENKLLSIKGNERKEIPTQKSPIRLYPLQDRLFVVNLCSNSLSVINDQAELLKTIPLGIYPLKLVLTPEHLYLGNTYFNNFLPMITRGTNAVTFLPLDGVLTLIKEKNFVFGWHPFLKEIFGSFQKYSLQEEKPRRGFFTLSHDNDNNFTYFTLPKALRLLKPHPTSGYYYGLFLSEPSPLVIVTPEKETYFRALPGWLGNAEDELLVSEKNVYLPGEEGLYIFSLKGELIKTVEGFNADFLAFHNPLGKLYSLSRGKKKIMVLDELHHRIIWANDYPRAEEVVDFEIDEQNNKLYILADEGMKENQNYFRVDTYQINSHGELQSFNLGKSILGKPYPPLAIDKVRARVYGVISKREAAQEVLWMKEKEGEVNILLPSQAEEISDIAIDETTGEIFLLFSLQGTVGIFTYRENSVERTLVNSPPLLLYPNPAQYFLFREVNLEGVRIYNILGQAVKEPFSGGIYYIKAPGQKGLRRLILK